MRKKILEFVIAIVFIICSIALPFSGIYHFSKGEKGISPSQSKLTGETLKNRSDLIMHPGEIELELTFLAKRIPEELNDVTPKLMIDTYVPETGFTDLRIRKNENNFEITKKIPINPGDYSVMKELTIPLNEAEYEALSSAGKRKVVKHRYCTVIDGYSAEVDVFQEDLLGLVLIDFEFESEEQKKSFKVPAVCLANVTQESFTAGGNLAGKSYEDIKDELDRFHYQAVFMS